MAIWNDPQAEARLGGVGGASLGLRGAVVDAGLRAYMLRIYNYMASGVLLSGLVALVMANTRFGLSLILSPAQILFMLAPLGFILAMSFGLQRMRTSTLQALFWAFSVSMGCSLSVIFLVYTGASIAATFFAAAGSFAGLSLFGYTTKRNLSGVGSFCVMGLWGLLITMVVAMFVPSLRANLIISVLGVLIFAGLTAWHTQRLKGMYFQLGGAGAYAEKLAIMGAVSLYLDFLNMFQFMLSLMGDRR